MSLLFVIREGKENKRTGDDASTQHDGVSRSYVEMREKKGKRVRGERARDLGTQEKKSRVHDRIAIRKRKTSYTY